MDILDQITYWIDESAESLDTAKVLIEKSKHLESAFFCNLSCEKMLKAAYIHYSKKIPPKVHSLVKLAQMSAIYEIMSEEMKRFINKLEVFQIEGRYPENRKRLYETTPKEVFSSILQQTEEVVTWIKTRLQ